MCCVCVQVYVLRVCMCQTKRASVCMGLVSAAGCFVCSTRVCVCMCVHARMLSMFPVCVFLWARPHSKHPKGTVLTCALQAVAVCSKCAALAMAA